MLDRLVDILLVYVLRAWLDTDPATRTVSWLHALRDPAVAAALGALHAEPARPWTIESLADRVAVSRATLARRFPALVGETPAAYLTRWRMDLASRRLRDTDDPIDVVARAVGYTSEYAFSRAFSRARAQCRLAATAANGSSSLATSSSSAHVRFAQTSESATSSASIDAAT